MFGSVLVPLDGSDAGESGLRWVEGWIARHPAKVRLLRVVPVLDATVAAYAVFAPPPTPAIGSAAVDDEAREAASALERVRRRLGEDRDVLAKVVHGDPGAEIVAAVKRYGADLVVMATHSRAGLARLVLGSVTEYVVRNAGVPVLVFPPSARAGAAAAPEGARGTPAADAGG